MPTTLQVRFGHEENFSRYLLESGQFEQLLARAGFAVAGEGVLEVPVAKGHEGREGRLDIYQPTTAGVVIGEMQYGTSDSNHRNRFAGYAKSVTSPAAIVWVAERFRDKDLQAVAGSKVPVLCVTAKLSAANNIVLTAIGGARLSAQSLEKRVQAADREAKRLLESVPVVEIAKNRIGEIIQAVASDPESGWFELSAAELVQEVVKYRCSFAKIESASRRRGEKVIQSAYFAEWVKDAAAEIEDLWASAPDQVQLVKEQEKARRESEFASEEARQLNREHEQWLLLDTMRSQLLGQDRVDAVVVAKRAARDAYEQWADGCTNAESVELLYRQAESACIELGFRWLLGLPCVGNFIPERYRLLGAPRDIADDLPGWFSMDQL
jgi:hypothetical protein